MQIQTGQISFNRHRFHGPQEEETEVVFPTPVAQATAILTGFDVAFSRDDGDHELGNLEVSLESQIDPLAPQRVNVTALFGLRDWSEEWDDFYEGEVFFSVIAD
jgi:hypothetical protein